MKSEFLTELETRDLDDENFVLLAPLVYRSKYLGGIITAEQGFISDGSSVPRLPIVYWFYGGRAHREGVIHDRLYRSPDHLIDIIRADGTLDTIFVTRKDCDFVFWEAQIVRKKPFGVRWPMYAGVRVGGFNSYRTGPERFKILKP